MIPVNAINQKKKEGLPGGPMVKTLASTAGGIDSIPVWGTMIQHATWHGQKKSKITNNNFFLKKKKIPWDYKGKIFKLSYFTDNTTV